MKKPFDVLAEGLPQEDSRGDKTAVELFVAGVGVWEARLQQLVGRLTDGKRPQGDAPIELAGPASLELSSYLSR